nr:SHIRT domain-containing protein [Streptococcus pluranimalium]
MRKFKFGVASVAISAFFMGSGSIVMADQVISSSGIDTSTEFMVDSNARAVEEFSVSETGDTTETVSEETPNEVSADVNNPVLDGEESNNLSQPTTAAAVGSNIDSVGHPEVVPSYETNGSSEPIFRSAADSTVETISESVAAITSVDGVATSTIPTTGSTTTEPTPTNMNGTSNVVYSDSTKYTFAALDLDATRFYFNDTTGEFQTSSGLLAARRATQITEIAFSTDKEGSGNVYAHFFSATGKEIRREFFEAGVDREVLYGNDYRIYYQMRKENGKEYPTIRFDRVTNIQGWFDEIYTNYEKALANTNGAYVGYGYFVPVLVDKETDYVVEGTNELLGRVTQTQLSGYKFTTTAPNVIVANGNTYELISTKTENPTGVINPLVNVGDVISVGTDANYVIRYELLDQSGTLSWKLLKPDGTQAVAVRDGETTSGIITAGQTTFVTVIVDERVGHRDVSGGEVTYYINNPYFPGGKTTYYYRLTEEASKKSTVVHEFVSGTPGKDLPKEVTDLTPAPKTEVPYGGEETPVAPTTTTVEVTDGTWSFESYDKLTEVVDQPEEKFTGTWVFTPKEEPKSTVVHEFVSGTPGKDLPKEVTDLTPAPKTEVPYGGEETPVAPTTTTVEVTDGTWTFTSYDKDKETVDQPQEKFVGTWVFTPKETPKTAEVVHEFVSGTEGKDLPKEVTDLTPAPKTEVPYGGEETPVAPTTTTVEVTDGTWTFTSYDKDKETVDQPQEKFVGTWVFTPKEEPVTEQPVTTHVDENGTPLLPQEDGTQPVREIPGYEPVKTTTDDKGNTVHVYRPTTPATETPVTTHVDENGTPLLPQEDGTQPVREIPGYEPVKTTTDDKGNTVHVYRPTTPATETPVTTHVDENGTPLLPQEDGTQPVREIPGYEPVKTTTDDKGNTVHVYRPTTPATETPVTTHVDENGTPLLPQEDGTQPVREIPGYEPVKTTTDDKGNTVHVYRPTTPVTEQPDVQLGNQKAQAKAENAYVAKAAVLPETGDIPTAHFAIAGLALMGLGLAVNRRKKAD